MALMAPALAVLLAWIPVACAVPYRVRVGDWYIFSPGRFSYGEHIVPQSQTSIDLAPDKPRLGCAIGWDPPVAIDDAGAALPTCKPIGFTVDGMTWPGL